MKEQNIIPITEIKSDLFPVDREEWYLRLIEELKEIVVEGEFNARWSLIETYHEFGKRILEENQNLERKKIYGDSLVKKISESIGKSERTVYFAIAFAKKYEYLDDLPQGKNTSWSKICKQLLPAPRDGEKPAPLVIQDPMLLKRLVLENMDYILEYAEPTDKGYKFFISRDRIVSFYNSQDTPEVI
jgi:hypothetical protein